jgi:hypothetical protein
MLPTFVAPEDCAFSCNCFTADKNAHWQAFSSDLLAAFVFLFVTAFATMTFPGAGLPK